MLPVGFDSTNAQAQVENSEPEVYCMDISYQLCALSSPSPTVPVAYNLHKFDGTVLPGTLNLISIIEGCNCCTIHITYCRCLRKHLQFFENYELVVVSLKYTKMEF